MIRELVYLCKITIPWLPPFVVLVALFMGLCLALYGLTKSKGYLVTFFSGFCYLVPWAMQTIVHR
jgi:hypothetical protein